MTYPSVTKWTRFLAVLLVIVSLAAMLPFTAALADGEPEPDPEPTETVGTSDEDVSAEAPVEEEIASPADDADPAPETADDPKPADTTAEPSETSAPVTSEPMENASDETGDSSAEEPAEELPEEELQADGAVAGYNFPKDSKGYRYYIAPGTSYRHTGWLKLNGVWYYFWSDGTLATGWVKASDGYWYYFDKTTGIVHRGWIDTADGYRYYMRPEDAREQTYWREIDGDWYYFGSNGVMRTGWVEVYSGYWYYFDKDTGKMHTGWLNVDGGTYYLDPKDGHNLTYWQKIGKYWYYFGNTGLMRTGWTVIGGYKYYFYTESDSGPTGANAANVTIDGSYVNAQGYTEDSWSVWNRMVRMAETTSSATEYLIMVDYEYCVIGVFKGSVGNWTPVYYWDCGPGKYSTPTVRGEFTINSKGLYFYSGSAKCWYWSEFYNGEYAIHSVLYSPSGYLTDGRVGMHVSHGCVRVAYDNAYWVYKNCPLGTKVYVY